MATTEAQKKATVKYNKSRDNIMIRPDIEEGQKIRDAAAVAGLSVQRYIIDTLARAREAAPDTIDKMDQPQAQAQTAQTAPALQTGILSLDTLTQAREAAQAAGETVPEYVARAIINQSKRDKVIREAAARITPDRETDT